MHCVTSCEGATESIYFYHISMKHLKLLKVGVAFVRPAAIPIAVLKGNQVCKNKICTQNLRRYGIYVAVSVPCQMCMSICVIYKSHCLTLTTVRLPSANYLMAGL